MGDIRVPPLYEHSLLAIPIDPAGPDVVLQEPHVIRFMQVEQFDQWFKGQQRQCTYNRTKNQGPEALDAAADRMRRRRGQALDGVLLGTIRRQRR